MHFDIPVFRRKQMQSTSIDWTINKKAAMRNIIH
jgi:hypothetical protein